MVSYNFLYNFLLICTLRLSVLNTYEISRNSVRQWRRSCGSNLLNNIFRLCLNFKVEKGYITEKKQGNGIFFPSYTANLQIVSSKPIYFKNCVHFKIVRLKAFDAFTPKHDIYFLYNIPIHKCYYNKHIDWSIV